MILQEAQLAEEVIVLGAIEHDRLTLMILAHLITCFLSFGTATLMYRPTLDHLHEHVVLPNVLNFKIAEVLLVERASYLTVLVYLNHALKA